MDNPCATMARSAATGGVTRMRGIFAHLDDETFCAGGAFARTRPAVPRS